MFSKKIIPWLIIALLTQFQVAADNVVIDDLIITGSSDGTAPAYDCTAGATLPFFPVFDNSSVTATIPLGGALINLEPNFATCVADAAGTTHCEYTCSSPEGSQCIGQDCVNGEAFNGDTLRIKENNTRIRLHDTTVGNVLGESWNIEANSSRNGGLSYLDFLVQSVNKDTIRLVRGQDGPVPSYDCTTSLNGPQFEPPSNGTLAIGEPIIDVQPDNATCDFISPNLICDHTCDTLVDYDQQSILTFGTATATAAASFPEGVAIGYNSSLEDGVVSVGTSTLARRIAHIAEGINATDALIKGTLDDYSIVGDQQVRAYLLKQQITDMNLQLDMINVEIDFIIDLDDDDDGFSDIDEGICGSDSLDDTSLPTDTDGDGLCDDGVDDDDDNDTVLDVDDAFPLDDTESVDTDSDGTGDNADTDDDNDLFTDIDEATCGTDSLLDTSVPTDTDLDGLCDEGVDDDDDNDTVLDVDDAFPLDDTESVDTDSDGTGDNADTDDDNDGVFDGADAFPLDPSESLDTDGDGTGNNADTDDDGDTVPDAIDAFPLNPLESMDTDGDGVGNNADNDDDGDTVLDAMDAFPLDASESVDTDGDGTGNNADTDDDGDGVLDGDDAYPLDNSEETDTDGDGIGDNTDTDDDDDNFPDIIDGFPLDANEYVDTDGDGTGNNADTDDDNDGVEDGDDAFPFNPSESVDTDGDGIGNNADNDDDNDGVSDSNDSFPLDSSKSAQKKGGGSFSIFSLFFIGLIGIRRKYLLKIESTN